MIRPVFVGFAAGILLVQSAALATGPFVQGASGYMTHFALGLFGTMLAAAVHCAVFTYFTVIGKSIRQAVALAKLDDDPLPMFRSLKAGVTRSVVVGLLPNIAAVALGAIVSSRPQHAPWHLAGAVLAVSGNAVAFAWQWRLLAAADGLLGRTMARYRQHGPSTAPRKRA